MAFVQFAIMCVLTILTATLLIGQWCQAGEWKPYMWGLLAIVALEVLGCRVTWKENKEE
jgi:hypothetical protein